MDTHELLETNVNAGIAAGTFQFNPALVISYLEQVNEIYN